MARSLTARQQEVYQFIRERIEQRGYGPTVREIGEFLKIKSPNGVMCHLKALQRKGMISRTANKSRSIELTDRPLADSAVCLPIHGKVESRACSMFTAPQSLDVIGMLQRPECYLLQYSGDDLLDYAIADGDILIIEHASTSQSGGLALVRCDDGTIELSVQPNLPHIVRMPVGEKGLHAFSGPQVASSELMEPDRILPSPGTDGQSLPPKPVSPAKEPRVIGIVIGIFRARQPIALQRRTHLQQRTAVW